MPLMEEPQRNERPDMSELLRSEKIRVKNRRKLYLDRHPSYFTSPDLELSGASNFANRFKAALTRITRSSTI
jgi:hypothetical protein